MDTVDGVFAACFERPETEQRVDFRIRRADGRDTFVALRRINPFVKAVLVSGYDLNGQTRTVLDEGLRGFLKKPFDEAELIRRVEDVLGEP